MELPDPSGGGVEEVEAIPSFDSSTPLQASEGHRPTEWKGLASSSLVQRGTTWHCHLSLVNLCDVSKSLLLEPLLLV